MKPDHDAVAADAASDAKADPQAKADPVTEAGAEPAKAEPETKAPEAAKSPEPAKAPEAEAVKSPEPEAVKAPEPAKAPEAEAVKAPEPAKAPEAEAAKSPEPEPAKAPESATASEPEAPKAAEPEPEVAKTEPEAPKSETVDAITGEPVAAAGASSDADKADVDKAGETPKAGETDSEDTDGGSDDEVPPGDTSDEPRGGLAGLWPPRTTKARVLLAALLVVLIGLGTGGYIWYKHSPASLASGVAFRVNGVSVTEGELDDQVQTLGALYGVQPPTDGPRLDAFHRDVAKSTVVAMVIDNAAAERNIAVADRQTSDFLAKYVASQYGEGQAGRDAFVKDLADKGTSEPKVLAEVKRQMTLKALYDQVTSDVTVSDADVRQTFDQRQAQFATPERREIHNVVLKTKEEADAVVAQVKAGTPIETIAQQQSIDDSTKAAGGNLGLVSAAELQKSYADAAFSTPVGGVFGPVETQKAQGTVFNVGKVVQSQPGAPADFDKIKDGVRQLVLSERAATKWHDFIEQKLKDADVVYADKYQPKDPDTIPTAPGGPDGSGGGQPGQPAPAPNTPPK